MSNIPPKQRGPQLTVYKLDSHLERENQRSMSGVTGKKSGEGSSDFAEDPRDLANTETQATYFNGETTTALSQDHQQYLLKRHGTLDLDPLPGPGGADPYNWPSWKVPRSATIDLFHHMLTRFSVESHQSRTCRNPRLHDHLHSRVHHPRV